MDEIATQTGTKKFVNKVDEFYASNGKNVTLIFMSRNSDDANAIALGGKTLRRFTLNKLTDSEISKLSENLFLLFGSAEHNNEFYIKLNDLDEEIRSNPLLLSQLAIVYQNTGEIPQSVIGIYDAIFKITFNIDLSTEFDSVPANYKEMLELELGPILKAFSQERYKLLSQGKNIEITKVFSKILKEKYASESKLRAEFLVEYLQNRSILIDGEFYHKMFLEYFTAVAYYEQAFDDYDEIENVNILNELFAHYDDAYWSAVIKLFLVKSDSCIDESTTEELYDSILKNNEILEYTLLFDTCRDLIRHKEQAQLVLVCDILSKSVDGTYPPYGPLFWYVPEYELYETAVLAADKLSGNAKALALVRDVCFIFGQKDHIYQITDKVDGEILFDSASSELSGVRKSLCELFYIGSTNYDAGNNIYPRCFNVAEAISFKENGIGVLGRMSTPFEDELGLFKHESYNEMGNAYIGLVSCPNEPSLIQTKFYDQRPKKISGIILSNTAIVRIEYIPFYQKSIKIIYLPENSESITPGWCNHMSLIHSLFEKKGKTGALMYLRHVFKNPKGISRIFVQNFWAFDSITEVYMNDKIEVICKSAFQDHPNLRKVCFANCKIVIEESAFMNCPRLEIVEFIHSKMIFHSQVFKNCKSLKRVILQEKIGKLPLECFAFCDALECIDISDDITEIDERAFVGCRNLKYIKFPQSLWFIKEKAFFNCGQLNSLVIPDNVLEIAELAFGKCNSLRNVFIASKVIAKIAENVFEECPQIEKIVLPSKCMNWIKHTDQMVLEAIHEMPNVEITYVSRQMLHDKSMSNNNSIEMVVLSNDVTHIPAYAFNNCTRLKSVIFPQKLKTIEPFAFSGCVNLIKAEIPNSVVKIGTKGFANCWNLQEVHLPKKLKVIEKGAFSHCYKLQEVLIPSQVTTIQSSIFYGCSSLERISLPRIPNIKEKILKGVNNCELDWYGEEITTEEIKPMERMQINDYLIRNQTFKGAEIEKIVFAKDITQIYASQFAECKRLQEVIFSEKCNLNKLGALAFSCCINLSSIELPKSLNYIAPGVFKDCVSLEEVSLPPNIRQISSSMFERCKALGDIVLPESIKRIGKNAFRNCSKLSNINVPSDLQYIDDYAFRNCTNIAIFDAPIRLKRVGIEAFANCSKLSKFSCGSNTIIEEGAFSCCTNLTNIQLPEIIDFISPRVFEFCEGLKSMVLPDNVSKISEKSFYKCSNLQSIVFPQKLTELGAKCFYGCNELRCLNIPITVYSIGDNAFKECNSLSSITISANFKDDISRIFGDINPDIIKWIY